MWAVSGVKLPQIPNKTPTVADDYRLQLATVQFQLEKQLYQKSQMGTDKLVEVV